MRGVPTLPEAPGLPLTRAMNAAAAGDLRGMFIMGENPMLSRSDQAHARKALEGLELLVVQDIFLTETALLADVVLPAACTPRRTVPSPIRNAACSWYERLWSRRGRRLGDPVRSRRARRLRGNELPVSDCGNG